MAEYHHIVRSDGTVLEIAFTNQADGDFHIDDADGGLVQRRSEVMDGPWAVVRQVHGSNVVDASEALSGAQIPDGDGVITSERDQPISVQGADCAPIGLITDSGPVGVLHAGWRGLAAGIIGNTIAALGDAGGSTVRAIVGPVICTDCYEFGSADLDDVASELGDVVRGQTQSGSPALDMRAGITEALDREGVSDVAFVAGCPACDGTGFSHRARKDPQRHCLVMRIRS